MASDWEWLKVEIMYRSSSPGLAGKKWQKTSSMSSKMIVVFPVPPAPIKRHACCVRFRKGVWFSSSCNATSIASANHLQADNCSGANLNPVEDFSNAATFRAIAADGLLRVRHSASGLLASLSAAGSIASFPPESVAARKRLRPIPSLVMAARCASSSVWVIIGVFSFNLICSSRGFAEDEPLFSPCQQAVEANRCNARSASLGTSYVQRTPSLCSCYLRCLQLHLETIMYWWVKLICQLPCMHQTAPPKSSWVQKMQCKRLPMCYNHTMIQPLTNESGNKRKYFSTRTFPQCCHIFPQSPLPMNPSSAMTTERTTTNSTATNCRNKQSFTTLTNDDACAVYFLYLWNDFKVLNVTWQCLT